VAPHTKCKKRKAIPWAARVLAGERTGERKRKRGRERERFGEEEAGQTGPNSEPRPKQRAFVGSV